MLIRHSLGFEDIKEEEVLMLLLKPDLSIKFPILGKSNRNSDWTVKQHR